MSTTKQQDTIEDRGSFESDTLHRMTVEAARYWVIEHHLRTKELPETETRFAYADGPVGLNWGNSPGQDRQNDPQYRPLRGKRIRITFTVEDQ